MKKTVPFFIIVIIMLMTFTPLTSLADENNVGFSVKAIIPDNQINKDKTYFDLKMKPEQEQDIQVILYNSTDEKINVKASIDNATTNENGLVVYNENKQIDPSLEIPLTTIAELKEKEIEVPATGSKKVTVSMKMPKKEFDGIILGGIQFEKVAENEDTSEGVQIKNKYAYVVGVQLSETNKEIEPDLHLKSIKPKTVNYRTAVVAKFQNSEPVLVEKLNLRAQIYKENETDPLYEVSKENINMAPNSTMDVVIDWDKQALKEGTYRLKMFVDVDGSEWKWDEQFTIDKNEAKDANEQAVETESTTDNTQWFVIGISFLVVIIVVLLYIIMRLKRGKE